MKKFTLIIAILAVLLSISFSIGCSSTYTYKVLDAETHKPVSGTVLINGRKVTIESGTIKTTKTEFTIRKDGYIGKAVSNKENGIIKLVPVAFLKIRFTGKNGSTVKLLSEETKIIVNNKVVPQSSIAFSPQGSSVIVSPAPTGTTVLQVKTPFAESEKILLSVKNGENDVDAEISFNEKLIENYLNSLVFPNDLKNGLIKISITGTVDADNINYDLQAKLRNGEVVEIQDKNIHYTFKNNKPYIVVNGEEKEVTDPEKIAALTFARNTIKNALELNLSLSKLKIVSFSSESALFSGTRTFEKRNYTETVQLTMKNKTVTKEVVHIASTDIENANLTVTMVELK